MPPAPDPAKIPKSQRRSPEASALDYVNLINDSVGRGFERLTDAQEKTELAIAQLTGQVKQTNKNLDKLGDRLDKMADVMDRQIALAEAQHTSIAELTKLCTVLATKAS